MKSFHQMLRKISSSPLHDQMMRFCAPLNDQFGINHFWYYRITSSGDYSFLGTHTAWNEFSFDTSLVKQFTCLRHPNALQSGIQLMKASSDTSYQETLQKAWDKFHINFNINLLQKLPEGIEAFGFASRFDDRQADERLLNALSLLRQFTRVFRQRHEQLFAILEDNQVNISSYIGSAFYERPKGIALPADRDEFFRKMGVGWLFRLTPREKDVLKFLANGYPASYIAKKLSLSKRTVENYIESIKGKLSCHCKSDLIQKGKEFILLSEDS